MNFAFLIAIPMITIYTKKKQKKAKKTYIGKFIQVDFFVIFPLK